MRECRKCKQMNENWHYVCLTCGAHQKPETERKPDNKAGEKQDQPTDRK